MPNLPISLFRIAAMATLIGGLTLSAASQVHAQSAQQNTMDQTSPMLTHHESDEKMRHGQRVREEKIENRIKTLHDKLGITTAEEAKWGIIAQAMRTNEDSIGQLMKQRYDNRKTLTAIDDLQSYEAIAEAHVEGLKKMIPAFQDLYTDMSDDQKKIADEAFGRFEGHRDGTSGKKHG